MNHGTFTIYTPVVPQRPAEPAADEQARANWRAAIAPIDRLQSLINAKAIFARRADGVDWYDHTREMVDGNHYALIVGGVVVSVATDAQAFGIIDGMTLVETTEPAEIGWSWDGTALSPPSLGQRDYARKVQSHIDTTAVARGYADGVAVASYAASTVSAWAGDALAFVAWRDAVWLYVYQQLAAVQAQQRVAPSPDGLVAELPAITWPAQ